MPLSLDMLALWCVRLCQSGVLRRIGQAIEDDAKPTTKKRSREEEEALGYSTVPDMIDAREEEVGRIECEAEAERGAVEARMAAIREELRKEGLDPKSEDALIDERNTLRRKSDNDFAAMRAEEAAKVKAVEERFAAIKKHLIKRKGSEAALGVELAAASSAARRRRTAEKAAGQQASGASSSAAAEDDDAWMSEGEEFAEEVRERDALGAETPPHPCWPPPEAPAPTETPPAETPLAETPLAETPPAETLPADAPPADAPPAEAPPADAPPADAPPADAPPAETPPAETPPAETLPAETPPAEAAPGEAPQAAAPTAAVPAAAMTAGARLAAALAAFASE
jgi:hypothetical protein